MDTFLFKNFKKDQRKAWLNPSIHSGLKGKVYFISKNEVREIITVTVKCRGCTMFQGLF